MCRDTVVFMIMCFIFHKVISNFVEPALLSCDGHDDWEKPVSQETFLVEFKKAAKGVAQHLREQPVIVAHSENTFDGSGIKRLLANKFELDKVHLETTLLLNSPPHLDLIFRALISL